MNTLCSHYLMRHDLVRLGQVAMVRICAGLEQSNVLHKGEMIRFLSDSRYSIPAIVRRQAPCDKREIGVGFSLPIKKEGSRLRYASSVDLHDIEAVITPYQLFAEVLQRPEAGFAPLKTLYQQIARCKDHTGQVGVYGAWAMAGYTGLPYVDVDSDIDILLRDFSLSQLEDIAGYIACIERNTAHEQKIGFDVEVILASGLGVKLKELLSRQKTVLAKGINRLDLVLRSNCVASLKVS